MSYTSFSINSANTDKDSYSKYDNIVVSVEIENTGVLNGAEVIQVYASDVKSSVMRPLKELKAFRKVKLKPGEKRLVELTIPVRDLAFYDEELNDWNIETGDFKLMIGVSSRDIKEVLEITVEKNLFLLESWNNGFEEGILLLRGLGGCKNVK